MSRLAITIATEAHAVALAKRMRPADAAELLASHGLEPGQGLFWALSASERCWTVLLGRDVVAMFGVAKVDGFEDEASAWLITSDLVEVVPVAFLRVCRDQLSRILESWPKLWNYIDARNTRALRWAEWLGFEVFAPIPYGVEQLPFRLVQIRRTECVCLQ